MLVTLRRSHCGFAQVNGPRQLGETKGGGMWEGVRVTELHGAASGAATSFWREEHGVRACPQPGNPTLVDLERLPESWPQFWARIIQPVNAGSGGWSKGEMWGTWVDWLLCHQGLLARQRLPRDSWKGPY